MTHPKIERHGEQWRYKKRIPGDVLPHFSGSKFLTFTTIIALLWHAWVGVRDIWMDYIKPVGLRLALQVFTLVWLVGCAGWAVQVLWRL